MHRRLLFLCRSRSCTFHSRTSTPVTADNLDTVLWYLQPPCLGLIASVNPDVNRSLIMLQSGK
jgi:hypothetical protein